MRSLAVATSVVLACVAASCSGSPAAPPHAPNDAGDAMSGDAMNGDAMNGAMNDDAVVDGATDGSESGDGAVETAGDGAAGDVALPSGPCDLVQPACGAGATCQLTGAVMATQCVVGGAGGPGDACTRTSDCIAGTQCFKYACGPGVCLRFCDHDEQCAHAGPGPGSFCADPVVVNSTALPVHTCTSNCDPTIAAIAASAVGCPTGLACLLVGNQDQVDCACPEASRTATDGAICASGADCVPGLICNVMGGTSLCRSLCRCDARAGACTAAKNDCQGAERCSPLTDNTIYGVCLP
jgi:hypothetical protein